MARSSLQESTPDCSSSSSSSERRVGLPITLYVEEALDSTAAAEATSSSAFFSAYFCCCCCCLSPHCDWSLRAIEKEGAKKKLLLLLLPLRCRRFVFDNASSLKQHQFTPLNLSELLQQRQPLIVGSSSVLMAHLKSRLMPL